MAIIGAKKEKELPWMIGSLKKTSQNFDKQKKNRVFQIENMKYRYMY